MKITDILQAYHAMPACDRLDLICRMLRHCIPYEMCFLGAVLLDGTHGHYKSYISKMEATANRVNYYSTMKNGGLTNEVCEKLCCALAVLHTDNRPVAEIIFNMLNDSQVMTHFEEANDLKVMQDFRLLYVMAVNHPALSFNQRQHLMYTFLQRMDSIFVEKSKYSFSGSFSNSMEKTLSFEGESGRYPPEGHSGEISPDAYIVRCEVHSVYKRTTDKRYAYMIQVEWSDGVSSTVRRTYGDFFSFQTKLLDLFPEEGGQKSKKHPRLIPFLPGKNYSKFLKNRDVAEKRLPELHRYSRELVSLPEHVSRCTHVLEFFKPKVTDLKEDYPAFHKITTLYDLIESGKVRSRVFSEPLKSSPTHSPILHNCGSPLRRATHNSAAASTDNTSPRTSHTLPPVPSTSTQQVNQEHTPIIPRRPTYPLSRQLQKSETSAFTPVDQTALSEDDHSSSITLTASVISIPGSGAPLPKTRPSHPQTTPTSSFSSPTNSSTATASVCSNSTSTIPSSLPMSVTSALSSGAVFSLGHQPITTDNYYSRGTPPAAQTHSNGLGSSGHNPVCYGEEHSLNNTSGMLVMSASPGHHGNAVWTHPQMAVASPTKVVGVATPTHSSFSPTCHATSPTSVLNSPLLSATLSPSLAPPIASPSPPHSGASTPIRGVAYPQQILYPPYSPIYWCSTSPLPSPLPSPKPSAKRHGSYTSVNQGQAEHNTLIKWLKSLRLHKYHYIFEKLTYEEMCMMTMEELERKGMTLGAANKLFKKLDELRKNNFIGFRDMPFSGAMARKPSTCSLPAALRMEQGVTPSSSFNNGFSPTGSTCSLDKYNHVSGMVSGGGGGWSVISPAPNKCSSTHEMASHDRHNEPPSTTVQTLANGLPTQNSMDTAVSRIVPSSSEKAADPTISSSSSVESSNTSSMDATKTPDTSRTKFTKRSSDVSGKSRTQSFVKSSATSEMYLPKGPLHASTPCSSSSSQVSTISPSASFSLANSSSWADAGEDEGLVNKPDWALMPNVNGEAHSRVGTGSTELFHSGTGMGSVVNAAHIVTTDSVGSSSFHHHHHHHHQVHSTTIKLPPSTPHAPIHPYHAHHYHAHHHPVRKRNSHEGGGHETIPNSSNIIIPQPLHPLTGHNQVGGVNSNWNAPFRPYLLPSNMTLVRSQGQRSLHYGHAHLNQNNNGLMRTPTPQTRLQGVHMFHAGGMLAYPSSHSQPPPPLMCYNCGKKGHQGRSCPGNTMDTDDMTSFHKLLERTAVNSNQPPSKTH